MRRHPAVHLAVGVAIACSLAACGGDDADDDPAEPAATLPTATTIDIPVAPERCEDTPDPTDYPEGGVPTALRPCTLPDEVVSQTIHPGTGTAAEVGDGVIYHATLLRSEDGELIDSTWTDGQPNNLPSVGTGGEIPGLDASLVGVQAGQVLRVDVPADQAFGDAPPAEVTAVRAGDDLTFVIEVLAVVPALDPDDVPRNLHVEPSTDATEVTTEDLIVGDGKVVEEGDVVVIALLIARGDNEVVLFSSWHQETPVVVPLEEALMGGIEPATLPGVFEGLQGARVGGRRVITMPPSQAWGDGGMPALGLPPGTDVIVIADILGAY